MRPVAVASLIEEQMESCNDASSNPGNFFHLKILLYHNNIAVHIFPAKMAIMTEKHPYFKEL